MDTLITLALVIGAVTTVSLNASLVSLLTGLIIPTLTGLITKAQAPAKVKQIVTMVLSAVAALIAANVVDTGAAVISTETLFQAGLTLAVSIVTYLGIYKPNDLNAKLAPSRGLGKAPVDPDVFIGG